MFYSFNNVTAIVTLNVTRLIAGVSVIDSNNFYSGNLILNKRKVSVI